MFVSSAASNPASSIASQIASSYKNQMVNKLHQITNYSEESEFDLQ
jgi:hypothetical protein